MIAYLIIYYIIVTIIGRGYLDSVDNNNRILSNALHNTFISIVTAWLVIPILILYIIGEQLNRLKD